MHIRGINAETIDGEQILHDVSLSVESGKLHVLMGPNGSGKSTLAQVVAGNPHYKTTEGVIELDGEDILKLSADERARQGLFVAFQQPLSIHGVSITEFMATALLERNKEKIRPKKIRERLDEALSQVGLVGSVKERDINVGFSGGESKRFEIAQVIVLGAKVAVLDEIDSGLDVDGIRQVGNALDAMRANGTATLLITHNPKVLSYISPDAVSIMQNGTIVASGGAELGEIIAGEGYKSFS